MPQPILAALLAALLPAAASAEVTVFAASSLKDALDAVAAGWEAAGGDAVTISYAGSPALAAQIEAGAPADLYLSAAPAWMDELDAKGLIEPGTRVDLLGNTLVLVAHGEAPPVVLAPGVDLAGLLGGGRLAMALVDSVPAGQYGKAALESLGAWEAVAPQVAQAENVRAALALVASGEAPFGIVYGSDAVASRAAGEAVTAVGTFPEDSHPRIVYPAALVAGHATPEARAFLDHLASPEAGAIFTSQGFSLLSPP